MDFEKLIHFTGSEIKEIRSFRNMTQQELADFLGVSKKTVEGWEYGISSANGPACRLLMMLASGENIPFVSKKHFLHGRRIYSKRYRVTGRWIDNGHLTIEFTYKKVKQIYTVNDPLKDDIKYADIYDMFGILYLNQCIRIIDAKQQLQEVLYAAVLSSNAS